ncbi:MAG: redoxin domain-containing protein [Desulfobacterales bacterium]|jgi:peroxiredoxin
MKRIFMNQLAAVAIFAIVFNAQSIGANSTPRKGGTLPIINLDVPKDPAHRSYLGFSGEGQFDILQIKAEVVIIQIFNMYCPLCQREASRVNELYENIEKDPNTRGKFKLIGIGAGNSQFEVGIYMKTYEVPFPLFSDGDFSIHQSLGEVRTPYFIGVKINDNGNHEIFYSRVGGFEKAQEFLKLMLELSGLK